MSEVEFIMGLSKSGKTRFLNTYLGFTNVKKERILLIIIGKGNEQIRSKSEYIKVKIFNSLLEISERKLLYILNVYIPHRILIEGDYFSIRYIEKILSFNSFKYNLVITSRINIINSNFIYEILKNKNNKIKSNIIIINNFDGLKLDYRDIRDIRVRNINSFLFCIECFDEVYFKFKDYGLLKGDIQKNIFKYLKEYIDYI